MLMALPVWRLYQSIITCCAAIAHRVSCENSCSLVSALPGPHNRRKGRRRRISTDRGSILRHLLAVPFLGSYLVEMKGKLNEMSKNLIRNSIYIYVYIYSAITWCCESIPNGNLFLGSMGSEITGGLVTMAQFKPFDNFRQMRCLDTMTVPCFLTVLQLLELPWQIDCI